MFYRGRVNCKSGCKKQLDVHTRLKTFKYCPHNSYTNRVIPSCLAAEYSLNVFPQFYIYKKHFLKSTVFSLLHSLRTINVCLPLLRQTLYIILLIVQFCSVLILHYFSFWLHLCALYVCSVDHVLLIPYFNWFQSCFPPNGNIFHTL